jgi:molybdopterin/thiamine biosynthesis adenylyltransferase
VGTLAEALITHLRGADPFGLYRVVERVDEDIFVISVGDLSEEIPGLIIRPEGWAAGLMSPESHSYQYSPPSELNPIGAALAAAMAATTVYQYFNAELVPDYEIQVPLWVSALRSTVTESPTEAASWSGDPSLPQTVDIGRSLLVGAGALGGNALSILGALSKRLTSKLDIAEFDLLEISNLNRLVAALLQHFGMPKAHIAALSLQGTDVEVNTLLEPYERLSQSTDPSRMTVEQYEMVVTGVDQMATRAFVQSDWPRFLINAGTGGFTWRVTTHPVDTEGACMGCLAGNGQQSYRGMREPVPCAVGQPIQPGQPAPPTDSYGFVSFFGAAFLVARVLQ